MFETVDVQVCEDGEKGKQLHNETGKVSQMEQIWSTLLITGNLFCFVSLTFLFRNA